jgi:REP element-mobilizing transposase RayT
MGIAKYCQLTLLTDHSPIAIRPRIEFEGAFYHLVSRGNRRETTLENNADRGAFIEALGEVCSKTGWVVHAFCLQNHHFHLVIATTKPNFVTVTNCIIGTYTTRFNALRRMASTSIHAFESNQGTLT